MPGIGCLRNAFVCTDCSQQGEVTRSLLSRVDSSFGHLPIKGHIECAIAEAFRCLKYDGLIICLSPNIKNVHCEYGISGITTFQSLSFPYPNYSG